MVGDKRREKGPTQSAVPDMDDEQDEADDKVRLRRFTHLTELACFQELVQRGLMTKKKAKAAIEAMDRKGYNQEGIKQFLLDLMYDICEKAASAEKKPHQREFSKLMYAMVRRVAEMCLWSELIESVERKMVDAIKHDSVRPEGVWPGKSGEKGALIVLVQQLYQNERMDTAMARLDEPDTFQAVPRLSILIQYFGVKFDSKVVK